MKESSTHYKWSEKERKKKNRKERRKRNHTETWSFPFFEQRERSNVKDKKSKDQGKRILMYPRGERYLMTSKNIER